MNAILPPAQYRAVSSGLRMNPYLPVLIVVVLGLLVGLLMTVLGRRLGPRKPTPSKQDTFECGLPQTNETVRINVKFTLTALMFMLFDVETIFLFLWAKSFRTLQWFGVIEVFVFLIVLLVGYIYVVRGKVLEWN